MKPKLLTGQELFDDINLFLSGIITINGGTDFFELKGSADLKDLHSQRQKPSKIHVWYFPYPNVLEEVYKALCTRYGVTSSYSKSWKYLLVFEMVEED